MWALVPLKLLAQAKQRLADKLTPQQRQELVLAMAADVLAALQRSDGIEHILIVSRNAEAQALAQACEAEVFAETEQADLPGALIEAVAYAGQQGANGVCIIPADAPLIRATDIDLLIATHRACTVVPDAQYSGTNALVLSPPDLLQPIFDGRSFRPHLRAAVAAGVAVRVLATPGLALDIDTPADLTALQQHAAGANTHTGRYLQEQTRHATDL